MFDIRVPPTQAHQLLTLGGVQTFLARQRRASIAPVLGDPVRDALRRGTELTRELRGRPAHTRELDDLLTKFRRVLRL